MKKLLIVLFVLVSSLASAQELTADTPASIDWGTKVLELILGILGVTLTWVSAKLIPILTAWLKTVMHFRGSAVVADALSSALGELLSEVKVAAADGRFTKEEINFLRARARIISQEKLKNLWGFYKKDLLGWVDEVLDVEMGKLLSRTLGSSASSSVIPLS